MASFPFFFCNAGIRLTKENQFSQLSYFNHSQQSGLQDFTMPFPAGVSERPSGPSNQNFEDKFHTMTVIRDETSADINQVRRQTASMLVERKSLIPCTSCTIPQHPCPMPLLTFLWNTPSRPNITTPIMRNGRKERPPLHA